MAAFTAALAVTGCDGLEFDVRAAADGVPVVIHDATLERVQGQTGRVAAMTAAALGEAGVPMLSDVLAAVGSAPYLDVELKVDVGRPGVEVLAAARGFAVERTVISSFSSTALETVARLAPGWPLWLNSRTLDAATIANAIAVGCVGVAIEWRAWTPSRSGARRTLGSTLPPGPCAASRPSKTWPGLVSSPFAWRTPRSTGDGPRGRRQVGRPPVDCRPPVDRRR